MVYILFHETNTGHSDDSDGYVEAVYATEEAAEAAKLAAIRRLVAEGEDVYWNPDTEEEGPADWTDDFRVIPFTVQAEPPAPDPLEYTCPTCRAIPGLSCTTQGRAAGFPHRSRARLANATERRIQRKTVSR
jgi:hypothetical protein